MLAVLSRIVTGEALASAAKGEVLWVKWGKDNYRNKEWTSAGLDGRNHVNNAHGIPENIINQPEKRLERYKRKNLYSSNL